jgi:hypothetical protein
MIPAVAHFRMSSDKREASRKLHHDPAEEYRKLEIAPADGEFSEETLDALATLLIDAELHDPAKRRRSHNLNS